jgi:hypothetical protein
VLLQNQGLQVVLRNPWESLTRPGFGGGTLVDAAASGWNDRVFEAFPLIEDGFMVVDDMGLGQDGDSAWVTFSGEGLPFPPVGLGRTGAVQVTWRLPVDSQVIGLEGADGLWLRPGEGAVHVEAGFVLDGFAVLTDGRTVADHGGALWLAEVAHLIVAPVEEAMALRWPDGSEVSGECSGESVEVWRDQQLLGVLGPEFSTRVPDDAGLVCVASGSAPGETTPPATGLTLTPGEEGKLQVRVADEDGLDLPVLLTWDQGQIALPVGGGLALIPPGSWSVYLEAGPAHDSWVGTVQVPGDRLELHLRRAIDTSDRVLLELGREAWPSWTSGLSVAEDLALAAASGRDLVIYTPLDEISEPLTSSWFAHELRGLGGSLAETDSEVPGRVWSWSWSANAKRAGHGAVVTAGRSPVEVLALASGGAGERFTVVDAAWVLAAGPPWTWDPVPDLFRLASLDDLPVLLDLLSHGIPVGVVGPLAWGKADRSGLPSLAALQRDLVTGVACATTGPLLDLIANVQEPRTVGDDVTLSLALQARVASRISLLALYVDGRVVAEVAVDSRDATAELNWSGPLLRSAVGVAIGDDWAVSAPILRTP